MKIAIGQRWNYHDGRYIWVVEVIKLADSGHSGWAKIVQMIQNPLLGTSGNCYNLGSSVSIPDDPIVAWPDFYTYLEGQDAPKE